MTNEDTLRSIGAAPETAGLRDAVHIAVVSVLLAYPMKPGQQAGLWWDQPRSGIVIVGPADDRIRPAIGVIDPFRPENELVYGATAWLFLTPGSITSLRHIWAHPQLPDARESQVNTPESYLRAFAEDIGISYGRLMELVPEFTSGGSEDWHILNYDTPSRAAELNNPDSEFWRHYAAVTGEQAKNPRNFFSCSC